MERIAVQAQRLQLINQQRRLEQRDLAQPGGD